jgi:hypothetical protein
LNTLICYYELWKTNLSTTERNAQDLTLKTPYEVMRRYGSDIKTETAQKEYDSAKQHRRWINQIRRALEVAQQARRAAPLWRRTKPGAWGHEVQAYQSRQANDHGDSRHP